jgi:hypothetical protein
MKNGGSSPQRITCRHCGKSQIQRVTRTGRIRVLEPGDQISKGPGRSGFDKPRSPATPMGVKMLRDNAANCAANDDPYPPNMPHENRRAKHDDSDTD